MTKKCKILFCASLMLSTYVIRASVCIDTGLIDENKIQHSEARWVDLSLEEERELAQASIQKVLKYGNLSENKDLLRIQKEIIEANPSKLWFNDGRHDYYIHPLKVITFKDGYKDGGSANYGDGIIFIDSMDIYSDNSYKVGVKNTIDNIHDNSALAFTIGHEIAHWKQNLKHYRSNEESVRYENQADISSLEYSEATLAHSYGGGLITLL